MAKFKYDLKLLIDQFVEVVTTTEFSVVHENENGRSEKKQPLIISGVLLAHDDENLYLGDETGSLSDVISKLQYVNIGISKPKDKYDELLDDTTFSSQDN